MAAPFGDVVRGYNTLASSLLDRWSRYASGVAARLDDGTYDAGSATSDLAAGASLAAETGYLLAAQAVESAVILAGDRGEPYIVDSEQFDSGMPGATLELPAALVTADGAGRLPAGAIGFRPTRLGPAETLFTLRADATGLPAGFYFGAVEATSPAGGASTPVDVWIVIA